MKSKKLLLLLPLIAASIWTSSYVARSQSTAEEEQAPSWPPGTVSARIVFLTGSTTFDFPPLHPGETVATSVNVTGVKSGDPCFNNYGTNTLIALNLSVTCNVSISDTVDVIVYNRGTSTIDLPPTQFNVIVGSLPGP